MKETRWQQHFENFERAFLLLKNAIAEKPITAFSDLEKAGIIQWFKCTFELAWKTLRDYLEYNGISLDQITPRPIIKEAFAAKIITDGQTWINILDDRNLMSHKYDSAKFEKAVNAIIKLYLPAITQLYVFLKEKDNTK